MLLGLRPPDDPTAAEDRGVLILTTSEAAAELRVTPFAVRKMVERRELRPIAPNVRPLRFRLLDVAEAQARRIPAGESARLDELAEAWRALE